MPPRIEPVAGHVPQQALDFFEAKGIKPSFSYEEVWNEEHAVAFTAAKIMETNVLTDVQNSLAKALKDGIPFEEWAKNIRQTMDRSGWSNYHKNTPKKHRLRTIYDTNMRSARAVGQWERIQDTKEVLPFLIYQLGASIRHRPEHVELEGTLLPVDDGFWDWAMPPSGYRCKCYVQQVTRDEAKKAGGEKQPPPFERKNFANKTTGKVESIPTIKIRNPKSGKLEDKQLVHPTFNYNPGKHRLRTKRMNESLDAARRDLEESTQAIGG